MRRTRRSTRSTKQVDYNEDKVDKKQQYNFSHSEPKDHVSWFNGAAKEFLELLWENREDKELPDSSLSIFQSNIRHFCEKWKIVGCMDKAYATNPTGDYVYFTQSAFEFVTQKMKIKTPDGNLERFQQMSDESFQIVPGTNCFEGYFGKHGLLEAAFNYHERRAPGASAETKSTDAKDSDSDYASDHEEEEEVGADLRAGLKGTPVEIPQYDISQDKEYQDAFDKASKTFRMEEDSELFSSADSKEQEEAAEEKDAPDYQLPGFNIRFLVPPPEAPAANSPPGNTPQAPPDNTPPQTQSDLHHPDDDPSFPDGEDPLSDISGDEDELHISGDEDELPQFHAWRSVHHLMWISMQKGVYKGWDEYKVTAKRGKWASMPKPPRNRCALGSQCIHDYYTPHLPPKKGSFKVIGWCSECKVHLHGVCFDQYHRTRDQTCPFYAPDVPEPKINI